ncbi:MAG: hypothetical protein JO345_17935 [Streptosporangiaceae bacterium]|nr:hypothetical protein [Streptosporangiaceae bacterium]
MTAGVIGLAQVVERFDRDVAKARRRSDNVLIRDEERYDGLNILKCFLEHVTDEGAGAAARPDELAPFAGCSPIARSQPNIASLAGLSWP